jgi:hypothetical protein
VWFSDASGCVFGGALVGWLAGAFWGAAWSVVGLLSGAAAVLLLWTLLQVGRRLLRTPSRLE